MDWVGSLGKSLASPTGRALFGWLAGFRVSQTLALRAYQRRLAKRYGTFTPASGPGAEPLPMREMYLPLAVDPGAHRRVLVTGEPGTGKSMLLRHMAFEFADGGAKARRGAIPVLVELKRGQVAETDLDRYLVEQLRRDGFHHADRFVQRALDNGTLRLLLDGLDEVAPGERRTAVTQHIEAFVGRYRDCEVIVTCRAAVRETALLAEFVELPVTELDDQLVREYVRRRLTNVEPLLGRLFGNPRVLALARVPLLLDMIINLYGLSHNGFPASRAQFYQQAVGFLLSPWHAERPTARDRINRARRALHGLAWTSLTVGDLAIDHDAADDVLLTEIVERSGLLTWTEDGYRFTHLTFQEFLAAEGKRANGTELLDRFRADKDRWLEPVVLWCGLVPDATSMVAALLDDGSITALECLSEARNVDAEVVRRAIERFDPELTSPGAVRAFGLAGSGQPAVLEFLERVFTETTDEARRRAAADALAASNLPRAVEFLSTSYSLPQARAALEHMRDSAVDALAGMARPDDLTPLNGLVTIGTRKAAHALVDLLWHKDERLAAGAAWRLGALLDLSVDGYRLGTGQRAEPRYLWVSEPFNPSRERAVIVSRVCQLLKHGPESAIPEEGRRLPDWLALALGLVGAGPLQLDGTPPAPEIQPTGAAHALKVPHGTVSVAKVPFAASRLSGRERLLLGHVSDRALATVLRDHPSTAPTERDWRRMFAEYPGWLLDLWPLAFALLLVEAVVSVGSATWATVTGPSVWAFSMVGDVLGFVAISWQVLWGSSVGLGVSVFGVSLSVSGGLIVVAFLVWLLLSRPKVGAAPLVVVGLLVVVLPLVLLVVGVLVIAVNVVVVLPAVWAVDLVGWWFLGVLWVLNLAGPAVAAFVLVHNRRAARSPLRAALTS
jgi:hypothetical protein